MTINLFIYQKWSESDSCHLQYLFFIKCMNNKFMYDTHFYTQIVLIKAIRVLGCNLVLVCVHIGCRYYEGDLYVMSCHVMSHHFALLEPPATASANMEVQIALVQDWADNRLALDAEEQKLAQECQVTAEPVYLLCHTNPERPLIPQ